MGTSVSQHSPRTLGWQTVATGYDDPKIPVDRVVQEIWRAAKQTLQAQLLSNLGSPLVFELAGLVANSEGPAQAYTASVAAISKSKQASLFTEIAKRAVMQSTVGEDRVAAFSANLFAEATDYFVSRDISGHLGSARLEALDSVINLKAQIRSRVREIVGVEETTTSNRGEWLSFVNQCINKLSRQE